MFKLTFSFLLIFFNLHLYTQQWTEIGPFYGELENGNYFHSMGLVNAIWQHPNDSNIIVMATNSSGIWKTNDRGQNWKCVTDKKDLIPGFGARNIISNPKNPAQLFALAGNYAYGPDSYEGRLLKSTDGGESWVIDSNFKNPNWDAQLSKGFFKDEKNLFICTSHQLMKSSDGGINWDVLLKLNEESDEIAHTFQSLVDFAVFKNGNILLTSGQKWGATAQVWLSDNKGENWKQLVKSGEFKELKGKQILGAKVTEANGSMVFIGLVTKGFIWLYKTTDFGNTFELQDKIKLNHGTGNADVGKFEIELSKIEPEKLYIGLIEFYEWDSVSRMKMLSPSQNISSFEHDDVRFMSVHLSENGLYEYIMMGNDGGVTVYYPEKKKFESLNGYRLPTVQVYNFGISQKLNPDILIGTQDNGTFEYIGEEKKWVWIAGGDGGSSWVARNGKKRFFCINASIQLRGGVRRKYYTPNQAYSSWFLDFPIMMSENEDKMFIGSARRGGGDARLYIQQTDQFKQNSGKEIKGVGLIGEIEIEANSPEVVFIASGENKEKKENEPKLLKSNDFGETFKDLTQSFVYSNDYGDTTILADILSYRTVSSIEIDPSDSETVYLSLTAYKDIFPWSKSWDHFRVLKSEDGGETWFDFSKGLPKKYPVNRIKRLSGSKKLIFCGTDEGIYVREYKGNSWKRFGENFPKNISVTDIEFNYCEEAVYVSTYGRGVWKCSLPDFKRNMVKIKNQDTLRTKFITHDLLIKKGETLVINNEVYFAKNSTITLEPKSKLIVDGVELKSFCNSNAERILIQKKKFLWIFTRKKGKVELRNNGKLFK